MWWWLWMGCVNPRPLIEPDSPVETVRGSPAEIDACVARCVQDRQMAAEPIEAIRQRCADDCLRPGQTPLRP